MAFYRELTIKNENVFEVSNLSSQLPFSQDLMLNLIAQRDFVLRLGIFRAFRLARIVAWH